MLIAPTPHLLYAFLGKTWPQGATTDYTLILITLCNAYPRLVRSSTERSILLLYDIPTCSTHCNIFHHTVACHYTQQFNSLFHAVNPRLN